MRRLAVILTLLAVTFAGATAATAASTTGPLGKITVEGNAGEKPTLKFSAPFSVSKTVDAELAAGTGDKLVKDQKITFDFVVVDGRTGKEIGTSYGAAPAYAVLDKTQVSAGHRRRPGRRVGREPGADRGRAEGRAGQGHHRERRQEERHAAVPRRRQEHPHTTRTRDGRQP